MAGRVGTGGGMQFDIVIRTAATSVLLLTALVLLLRAPRAPVARAFLPFALGLAGFVGVNTAFDAAELPAPLWPLASFASRMAVPAIWLFCLVLFDDRPRRGVALAVVGGWLALVVVDKDYFAPAPPQWPISAVLIALGSGLLLHAGWRVVRELRGDLVDARRRARPLFALLLLALVAMDFGVDLLQGYGWRPAGFLHLQNTLALGLATGLAAWLLPGTWWLPAARPVPAAHASGPEATAGPAPAAGTGVPDPDAALLARLEAVMRDGRAWLDPGLTIAGLAARVGLPEPTLRRVINHRLGHGHFRHYLNDYRVAEARRRLRDPAHADEKILAIALDSGFASLASFNRAFRQATGCAPSEYRAGAGDGSRA